MEVPGAIATPQWRAPIIAGLASVPVTLGLQWRSAGSYVFVPVLFAGLIVGYLFAGRPTSSRRAGFQAGLVGGLGGLVGGWLANRIGGSGSGPAAR